MDDDIIGRRTDETLQDANQFNIEIVSQAGEGIIVYDRDLRYVVWNRFMERMTGAAAKDIIGKNALDLFPHLYEQGVDRLLKRALNGETVTSPDIPYYSTFSDKKGWVVGTYAPHRNARGEIIGVIATLQDITERKRAEQALQISDSKYRMLHDTMIDAFASVDMDGRITDFNESYRKMLGYEPDELYAFTYTDLTPTNWHTFEDKIVNEKILPKGYSDIYEKEYRKKDGTVFPVELRTYLLRDEAGNPSGMWAIVRNITERKRTEKALKESEERSRAFFNTSRDCVFITSVDGRWVDLNDAAVQFFGYESKEDLLKVEIKDLYANSDDRMQHLQVVNEKGYTQEYPVTLRKKDGTIINTLITSVIRKDGQGRIIGYQGTIRDITDRKRAENALRESEQRLANIIDFLPDATFAVDREGKVIAWNRAIENMTGIAKDEMLNRGSYAYAVPFYKEPRPILIDLVFQDQKKVESTYTTIRRKGDQIIAEASTPMLNQGKGAYLWGVAAPLYDRNGSIIGAIESIRDITERKREQEELQNNLRFLETMINTIPSPIFVKDRQGRYSGCNDSFARQIVGLPKESIIGKSVYELPEMIPSDLADMYHEQDQELFREPGIQVYETQAQCADGVKRDFLFSKATFNNFAGEVAGIVGVMLDITERKQMEAVLQESKDYLYKIINSIGDPIFVIDRQHRHVLVNDALCALTNRTHEEFIGKTPYDFYPKEQADVFLQKDEIVFGTGIENVNEETITDSEGVIRTIITKKTLYKDASGNKSIVGIIRDITDRKKAEEELRRSEERLRLAIEGGELGTYTYDFISGRGDWSTELKAFYGLRDDEPLVLDEDGVAKALHPEDRSVFLSAMNAANDPYGNVDGILELDYRIIRTDGSIRWLRVHGRTEFIGESNNRHPWRAAGIVTDITERKKAEDALKESRARQELAIQSALMGSWVLDVVENRRDFDAQTSHLLGIDHATFKGSPDEFFRVVHPNDRDTVEAALIGSIKQDAPYESAYRVIRPDGSIRHIVARGRVIRDQNRRPLKLIGIIWDDTEHKQAEEALRTSHQILDGIINAIPVRVFWKDRDLVYLGCNAIFAQDAGFADSKDIVGKDDYQMGWHDQAELYRTDDRQVIESGRSKLLIEEPQTTPEGRTIVLLTSKMPLCSSEGEIIGVLGTYMDITERKRMESELRRSRDELELQVKDRTEELARKNAEMERFI
ncbi:MAG: PAS domain S-box protein [Syntrophales bacterium]